MTMGRAPAPVPSSRNQADARRSSVTVPAAPISASWSASRHVSASADRYHSCIAGNCQQALHIARAGSVDRQAVGLDAKRHRRKECVGCGEILTREERSAKPPQPVAPEVAEPEQILLESVRQRMRLDAHAAAHRAVVAQGGEARMHFRRRRARPGAGAGIRRPHAGMTLRQVFGDRQRIPHAQPSSTRQGTRPLGENGR